MVEIRKFVTEQSRCPYDEWTSKLDTGVAARVATRLDRVRLGNFGDAKSLLICGLYELRLQFGAGYRIYFGRDGDEIVLLLCGGDKSRQKRDIERAKRYWKEYLERIGR